MRSVTPICGRKVSACCDSGTPMFLRDVTVFIAPSWQRSRAARLQSANADMRPRAARPPHPAPP